MNPALRLTLLGLTLVSLSACPITLSAAEKPVLLDRVAAGETVTFDVYIPIQHRDQLERDLQALHDPNSPSFRKWLTPAQFHARYGATDAQIEQVRSQLAGYGLETTVIGGHHVRANGPANAVEQALGASLMHGELKNGKTVVVAANQRMALPDSFVQANAVVLGFSHAVHMRTHARPQAVPDDGSATSNSYFFTNLKQAYRYPSYKVYTGRGITIATLVPGAYKPSDMVQYFGHEKLAVPHFSEVNVDGGYRFDENSFETELDFEQAGGMAPGSHLIHYNIPDLSDESVLDGLLQIVLDNKADIVSMSFGGPELFYTADYNEGVDLTSTLQLEDDLIAQGTAQGITFIASSGDRGAVPAQPVACLYYFENCGMFRASAEFPASSPHVTAVGGTNLVTTADAKTLNSAYVSEEAYADPLIGDVYEGTSATGAYWGSGGGNSIVFARPDFQSYTNTGSKGFRTVPDIAMHMGGCPYGVKGKCNPHDSSVVEVFNGDYYTAIGTSASAPDFAGLVALGLEQLGSRAGNANYYIYTLAYLQATGYPIKAFRQGIPGYNGLYHTTPTGYNRVLGNGTPNGFDFLLAPNKAVAGIPLSPSNP